MNAYLIDAVANERYDMLSRLLTTQSMDADAMLCAGTLGKTAVLDFLLRRGVSVHINGNCALRFASANGHLDTVSYLLSRGASVRAQNDDALTQAYFNGFYDVAQLLIASGAKLHV